MAFSHSSTLGPRMKCCDSITSVMAASTSRQIVAYCALRSSRGTCIDCLLFQLSIRFGALAQLHGQRFFFLKVETPQDAGFRFLVTVSTFWTPHHSIHIRRVQPVAMAAYPSCLPGGIPDNQSIIRHVFGDHGAGPDKGVAANSDAANDRRIGAN